MIYRLIILSGPLARQQVTVTREPMTIGSAEDCSIRLEDEELLAHHAQIEHRDDGLSIRDLGSLGTVLVNHRETRDSPLKHGDEIEIGRTRFLVQARVKADLETPAGAPHSPRRRRRRPLLLALATTALTAGALTLFLRLPEPIPPPDTHPANSGAKPDEGEDEDLFARLATPADIQPRAADPIGPEPASPSAATSAAPSAEEIGTIREDLQGLKRMMEAMLERQATAGPPGTVTAAAPTTTTPAQPVAPAPQPKPKPVQVTPTPAATPPAEAPASRQQQIDQLMADIRMAVALEEYPRAERLTAAILALDPAYWPAHEEQARVFERQGNLARATAVWQHVGRKTGDAEWKARANREQARLTRLLETREVHEAHTRGRISIVSVAPTRFPATETHDDMRTFTITLQRTGATAPAREPIRVDVSFFDKDPATGRIEPSRAGGPRGPLKAGGTWSAEQQTTVTAVYSMPAGKPAGQPPRFYGYIVRVYSGDRLEDTAARPADLLPAKPATAP